MGPIRQGMALLRGNRNQLSSGAGYSPGPGVVCIQLSQLLRSQEFLSRQNWAFQFTKERHNPPLASFPRQYLAQGGIEAPLSM